MIPKTLHGKHEMGQVFIPIYFDIVRTNDHSIHEAIRAFANLASLQCTSLNCTKRLKLNSSHPESFTVERPFMTDDENMANSEFLESCLALHDKFFTRFEYKFGETTVIVDRHYDSQNEEFTQAHDRVAFTLARCEPLEAFKKLKTLRNQFKIANEFELPQAVEADLSKYYNVREANLSKLEDKLGELVSKFADYRIQIEKELLQKQQKIEDAFQKSSEAKEADFAKSRQELEQLRQELDARAAKINDRENVHERRRLYEEIKKQIQNKSSKPELTKHTKDLTMSGCCQEFWLSSCLLSSLSVSVSTFGQRQSIGLQSVAKLRQERH
jgi:hypothetical protein